MTRLHDRAEGIDLQLCYRRSVSLAVAFPPIERDGVKMCCYCGTTALPKGRRRYCSQVCRDEAWIRCDSGFARFKVEERDGGLSRRWACRVSFVQAISSIMAPLGRDEAGQPILVKLAKTCSCDEAEAARCWVDRKPEQVACWCSCHLAGQPYTPASGTEGRAFASYTCDICEASRPYHEAMAHGRLWTADDCTKDCPILPKVVCGEQPDEWVRDENGHPTCTAFVPELTPAEAAHQAEQQRLVGQRKSMEKQGQGLLF